VAIYRLLQNSAFGPEDIERMVAAYDEALRTLSLANRTDPVTEKVAKRIIEIAQSGVRDPKKICSLSLESLDLR
jgi:hypothetical protein